jgi:hypothetical protein
LLVVADRADPKTLRALAHPLRWRLIDLIDSEATATATRCAEILGESVASCSCCRLRLGDTEGAVSALSRALHLGFRDLDRARADPL